MIFIKSKLHQHWQFFCQIFLPLVLIFSGITAAFVWTYAKGEQKNRVIRSESVLDLSVMDVSQDFMAVVSDLKLLTMGFNLRRWLDSGDADSFHGMRQDMLAFARAKPWFDQTRFLDETGMEVVRINHNDGKPALVGEENLQNKSNRYYFKDTFALSAGSIFVSPLDLNVEHDEVERPFKPMLRLAAVIFDSAGKKRGVVLLNYRAGTFLEHAISALQEPIGEAMFFNRDGYWFHAPDRADEWGFMFGNNVTFPNRYPDVRCRSRM